MMEALTEFSQECGCPFCGSKGLKVAYSSAGTEIYCEEGCHGSFNFPAFPDEVFEMWKRKHQTEEGKDPIAEMERQSVDAELRTIRKFGIEM